MLRTLALMSVATFAPMGCVDDTGFRCENSDECDGQLDGRCEATGFCSFGDSECESGYRYSEAAGALSNTCSSKSSIDVDGGMPGIFDTSNIDSSYLNVSSDDLTLASSDGEVHFNTNTGSFTRVSDGTSFAPGIGNFDVEIQSEGPDLAVLSLGNLSVEEGALLRIVGTKAAVFAVGESVEINGVINLSAGFATRDVAGPGGYRGGRVDACAGEGPGGGGAGGSPDFGGGGGGYLAAGGKGGDWGSNDPGGAGGAANGMETLIPLVGGSGGGCGGIGQGGGGGGALQISAGVSISLADGARIVTGGEGGTPGANDNAGGGGGAGGAILLESLSLRLNGTLAANGGGGGAGADGETPGQPGEPGRSDANVAMGGLGTGQGASGGAGGAGEDAQGSPGEDTLGEVDTSDNAGGGGGSAGRIHVRGEDIVRTGVVSPSAGYTESPL